MWKQWVWQLGDLKLTKDEFKSNWHPAPFSFTDDPQFLLDLESKCNTKSEASFEGTYKVLRASWLPRTMGRYWVNFKIKVTCCKCDGVQSQNGPGFIGNLRWNANGNMWGTDRYDFNPSGQNHPDDEDDVATVRRIDLIPFIGKDYDVTTPEIGVKQKRACGQTHEPVAIDW